MAQIQQDALPGASLEAIEPMPCEERYRALVCIR